MEWNRSMEEFLPLLDQLGQQTVVIYSPDIILSQLHNLPWKVHSLCVTKARFSAGV